MSILRRVPLVRSALLVAAVAILALAGGPARAQGVVEDPLISVTKPATVTTGPASLSGDDPEALADEAVQSWLDTEPRPLSELSRLDAETLCRELPALFAAPPPPAGTEVDIGDRQQRDTGSDDRRRYTYAAEIPPDRLDVVEVVAIRDGQTWRVERVGFQIETTTGRSWLQSPAAGVGFALVSLLLLASLFRPSPLRRWLASGRDAIREHRRLVTWTMILGWSVVAVGLWSGSHLPDACEDAVLVVLGSTLEQVGATEALASGDVARTALVIFYQNFFVVTLTALFGSALLLGVPAYLLAGASFLAQSTAFGVLGVGGFPEVLFVAVLFVIEFTAYFLVVSGGGMLVVSLARGGFAGLGAGYRKLISTLPWAGVVLLVGAWYEAAILLAF